MPTLAKAAVVIVNFLNVQVVSITDGDTLRVNIPGEPAVFGEKLPVRIKGIDAPELKGKTACEKEAAKASKAALTELLAGQTVDLTFCERDLYFRLACSIRLGRSIDIGSFMLEQELAVPYSGGHKPTFICKE